MTELSGFLYNDAGVAVVTTGCGVDLFPTGCNVGATGGSPTATTDTDANGFWTFSGVTTGQFDVRITSGSSVRFIRYDNEQNVCRLEVKNLVLNDGTSPNYLINIAAGICPATDRTLTLPSLCGNRTFQFIDQVQTISAIHTHSANQIYNDTTDVAFGTSSDSLMRWSTGDASNHALVIAVGQSNQVLHIAEKCDVAVDWNTCPNAADSELHIHSSTTPATDYLMIGRHDGTKATIDVVGGTQLCFDFAGTTSVNMGSGATGLTVTDGDILISNTGTVTGIKFAEPSAAGANTVELQAPATLAADIVLRLPPDVGCCGQQLTTSGAAPAVLTWAAASKGEYKDDLGLLDPSDALATIIHTPIHQFRYNRDKMPAGQWGCFTHEMTGIFAEEAPWAMQGKNKGAFSPINSMGMLTAAVQELARKVAALEDC